MVWVFFGLAGTSRVNMGDWILESPMPRRRERKCRHCGHLYEPDPRNRYHQRYCSQPACRQASKTASQHRWRASPKGKDYFCGRANVLRVQRWREAHPGYWRSRRKKSGALQDHCPPQTLVPTTFYEKRHVVKTESSQWFSARKRFSLLLAAQQTEHGIGSRGGIFSGSWVNSPKWSCDAHRAISAP